MRPSSQRTAPRAGGATPTAGCNGARGRSTQCRRTPARTHARAGPPLDRVRAAAVPRALQQSRPVQAFGRRAGAPGRGWCAFPTDGRPRSPADVVSWLSALGAVRAEWRLEVEARLPPPSFFRMVVGAWVRPGPPSPLAPSPTRCSSITCSAAVSGRAPGPRAASDGRAHAAVSVPVAGPVLLTRARVAPASVSQGERARTGGGTRLRLHHAGHLLPGPLGCASRGHARAPPTWGCPCCPTTRMSIRSSHVPTTRREVAPASDLVARDFSRLQDCVATPRAGAACGRLAPGQRSRGLPRGAP